MLPTADTATAMSPHALSLAAAVHGHVSFPNSSLPAANLRCQHFNFVRVKVRIAFPAVCHVDGDAFGDTDRPTTLRVTSHRSHRSFLKASLRTSARNKWADGLLFNPF